MLTLGFYTQDGPERSVIRNVLGTELISPSIFGHMQCAVLSGPGCWQGANTQQPIGVVGLVSQ